jgi:hypothetical protein
MNSCGTRTCAFDVTVVDNTSPTVVCKNQTYDLTYAPSKTITPNDLVSQLSDNCGISSLTASKTTFSYLQPGVFNVIIQATDNSNRVSVCTSAVTIIYEPPAATTCFNCPLSKTIPFDAVSLVSIVDTPKYCDNTIPKFIYTDKIVTIPCGTLPSTRPEGIPFDAVYNPQLAVNADWLVVRKFEAIQGLGFSTSCYQILYVQKPDVTISKGPEAATSVCQDGVPYINPFDNGVGNNLIRGTGYPTFNGSPIIDVSRGMTSSYTDAPIAGGVLVRTWLVKDRCGVSKTFTQTISIPTCVVPQIAISGEIKRETGEMVSAMVKVTNQKNEVKQMEGGFYSFPTMPINESYRIRPERNSDVLNGVTTYDLNVISRYILDIEPAKSPYQLIAMDVNRNGEVEAGDMLVLRQLILRKITEIPNNTAWRFIPQSYVFKNPNNPFAEDFPEILSITNPRENIANANFVAVKVGDGNLSARTSNLTQAQVRNAPEVAFLELPDILLEQGNTYKIALHTTAKSFSSLQFALKINPEWGEIEAITGSDLPQFGETHYAIFKEKGIVSTAWSGSQSFQKEGEKAVFYLTFKAKKSGKLTDIVSLKDDFTEGVVYDAKRRR